MMTMWAFTRVETKWKVSVMSSLGRGGQDKTEGVNIASIRDSTDVAVDVFTVTVHVL